MYETISANILCVSRRANHKEGPMGEDRIRILNMVATGKISVEEGEKLLEALGKQGGEDKGDTATTPAVTTSSGKTMPKFLRVEVQSTSGDNVNVKVPMQLLRAGMKLTSLIPPQAMDKINDKMHDREIRIDNGWVVKIGRGLDFYQRPDSWFGIGATDYSLRKCLETKVDIYRN